MFCFLLPSDVKSGNNTPKKYVQRESAFVFCNFKNYFSVKRSNCTHIQSLVIEQRTFCTDMRVYMLFLLRFESKWESVFCCQFIKFIYDLWIFVQNLEKCLIMTSISNRNSFHFYFPRPCSKIKALLLARRV
jgi:hypothetical protein